MHETDEKLQRMISLTLRGGVLSAGILGSIGAILYLSHSSSLTDFRSFQGANIPFASLQQILRQALLSGNESWQLRGLFLAQLGILLLLLTPILRVLFSMVGFALEGDRVYVLITLAVMLVLAVSTCLH